MPSNRTQRRMVTIAQAAEEYGVSAKTIRRYISAGRIEAYRFGPKLIRLDLDECDTALRPMGVR